jgi:hypothetical protein
MRTTIKAWYFQSQRSLDLFIFAQIEEMGKILNYEVYFF